eukprot:scaffold118549_cov35-Attheya_sp.AAC.1
MEVPASADDPSAEYETVIDEMIARAPIETAVPGTPSSAGLISSLTSEQETGEEDTMRFGIIS